MGALEGSRFFDNALLAAPELKTQYLAVIRQHSQQLDDLLAAIRGEYVSGRGAPDADGIRDLIIQEAGDGDCDFDKAVALVLKQALSYSYPPCIEGKKSNDLLGRNSDVLEKPEIKGVLAEFAATRNKIVAESPYLTDQFDYPSAVSLAAELKKWRLR